MQPLITVLGASGLLGSAVARELARRPVRLRLVGRRPSRIPPSARASVEVRRLDLREPGAVVDSVSGADAVIHLVAHMDGPGTWRVGAGDQEAERVNVGLVRDVLAAVRAQRAKTPPLLVFAGSMSQAGKPPATGVLTGGEPDEPRTVYDRHKLAAERAIEAATAEGVVRGTTLRLATLYSQGTDPTSLDRGVTASMTRRAFAGQPLTMWHDGKVCRDLLCVDDAARAFVSAVDHPDAVAGRHWLVGTGVATSIVDLFSTIAKMVAGCTGEPPVPVVSVAPAEHSVPTDAVDFVLDPSAFQRATGWCARVSLLEGLEGMVAGVAREPVPGVG